MALIDARLFDHTSQSDIQVLNLKSIQSKVLNTFQIKFINQIRIAKSHLMVILITLKIRTQIGFYHNQKIVEDNECSLKPKSKF